MFSSDLPGDAVHTGGVTAVIPLKALRAAKSRLAPDLDAATREALTAWMFGRVVTACLRAKSVTDVLVIAGDHAAGELASQWPVRVVVETRVGLPAALQTADTLTAGAAATLVVAADLPLAQGFDLDRVCTAAPNGPAVVVVPTRDGGTAVLLRRPPTVMGTRYGPHSAVAHLEIAAEAGIQGIVVDVPSLALDVDTAGNLREAADSDSAAMRWANELRIPPGFPGEANLAPDPTGHTTDCLDKERRSGCRRAL